MWCLLMLNAIGVDTVGAVDRGMEQGSSAVDQKPLEQPKWAN